LSLVVAAGIPAAWLDAGDVAVSGLPTWYGRLDLRLRRGPGEALLLSLSGGLRLPPGGIRFAPPGGGAIREARVNGCATPDFNATEVTITLLPAEVVVMV
jgi:hypothetical protein